MAGIKTIAELKRAGLIKTGTDERLVIQRIPLGIAALDRLLGGGLPVGRCILNYGPESTGKTLFAQYATAAVQQTEKPLGLYMDLEGSYDESWWIQSGVDTSQLMVSNPATGEEAVDIVRSVIAAEDRLGIIIVDGIAGMVPAPEMDPEKGTAENKQPGLQAKLVTLMYRQIKHDVTEKKIVFLSTNQMRANIGAYDELAALPGGKAQRHYSSIILRTAREGWIKQDKEPIGFYMEIISKKNKTCGVPDGSSIVLPFLSAGQIDLLTSFLEEAVTLHLITKAGPYYTFGNVRALGMPNLRKHFAEHEDDLGILKAALGA